MSINVLIYYSNILEFIKRRTKNGKTLTRVELDKFIVAKTARTKYPERTIKRLIDLGLIEQQNSSCRKMDKKTVTLARVK